MCGTTPESLCYEAMMDNYLESVSGDDNYFINFSDGQPYFGNDEVRYVGSEAEDIVRNKLRS